jgi:hypothetical protein
MSSNTMFLSRYRATVSLGSTEGYGKSLFRRTVDARRDRRAIASSNLVRSGLGGTRNAVAIASIFP